MTIGSGSPSERILSTRTIRVWNPGVWPSAITAKVGLISFMSQRNDVRFRGFTEVKDGMPEEMREATVLFFAGFL